jgi:hypothetical protein
VNEEFFRGEADYWRGIVANPYPAGSFQSKEWSEGFNCAFENDTYYGEDNE